VPAATLPPLSDPPAHPVFRMNLRLPHEKNPPRLCAAGAVLLASLVTATAADSKLVVAMLPKAKGNAYFISCKAGADKAAKELGIQLLFDGPTDSNAAKQNEIVENWITLGVDVIAVAAETKRASPPLSAKPRNRHQGPHLRRRRGDRRPLLLRQPSHPRGHRPTALMDDAARLTNSEGEFAMIVASLTAANQREWQKHVEARSRKNTRR
jgi:rhamnose transport system substrate-binding protein